MIPVLEHEQNFFALEEQAEVAAVYGSAPAFLAHGAGPVPGNDLAGRRIVVHRFA